MTPEEGYRLYRGRGLELSKAAVEEDPTLTLVRGHYFCPIWNSWEQHWWTKRPDGTIYDPTARQFPSAGLGIYEEFNGYIECSNCGKEMLEHEAAICGSYAFCCDRCYGQFVGVL